MIYGGDTQLRSPFILKKNDIMINTATIILIIKYILGASIFIGIICAPAWIARQADKGKQDMYLVRLGSWLFCWSVIGWFYALYVSAHK